MKAKRQTALHNMSGIIISLTIRFEADYLQRVNIFLAVELSDTAQLPGKVFPEHCCYITNSISILIAGTGTK